MSDTTVLTVVENDSESGTFDLMVKSVRKFSRGDMPKMIVCDNGRNGHVFKKYANDSNITIVKHTPTMTGGSLRHGEGLNHIFPMVKTKKTAIIESDCIITDTDWDYLSPFNDVMAAYKDKEKQLYHICFMVFRTELLKGIDFRPGKKSTRVSGKSFAPEQDVGWTVKKKIDPARVCEMRFIDCKTGVGEHFDGRFQSDELWLGRTCVCCHWGRGSCISGKAIREGFEKPSVQLKNWKEIAERIVSSGRNS